MTDSGNSAVSGQRDLPQARRIVVKVGSSSVSGQNIGQIESLVDALAAAHDRGTEVILVSSGAIANGLPFLQLDSRPADLATQQAAAAVGQTALMLRYQRSLDRHKIVAGQVLLTAGDLRNPTSRSNAQRAVERLLTLGVLPIVNENDTVATQEIRFGDNDHLAALVALLVAADAMVLLSDVDALYTRPPHEPGAQRVSWVPMEDDLSGIVLGAVGTSVGTGGATTKVAAAKLAAEGGTSVLLTSAAQVQAALLGETVGTWFAAADRQSTLTTGSIGLPTAE